MNDAYQMCLTMARNIRPNMDPEALVPEADMRVGFIASQILREAALTEFQHKTSCSPPEHLREVLVPMAKSFLWDGRPSVNRDDPDTQFDICFDEWCDWYEYGILQKYCQRWNLGDLPDLPEPGYIGPHEEHFAYHQQCFRESFR